MSPIAGLEIETNVCTKHFLNMITNYTINEIHIISFDLVSLALFIPQLSSGTWHEYFQRLVTFISLLRHK